MDKDAIIKDPFNSIKLQDNKVSFPSWLTDQEYQLPLEEFDSQINWRIEDHAVHLHASFYDATVWYPWIQDFTMKSKFIDLSPEEVHNLIYDQELPDDKKKLVLKYIKQGYQFVKSSKKSSHFRIKVTSYDKFIDEITHPQVIMSFKNGCHCIFMREYIKDLGNEYRVYIYQQKIRYIECYLRKHHITGEEGGTVDKLTKYIKEIMPHVKYHDYVLDIGERQNGFICIEINTPLYLFAGLNYTDYYFERDKIHMTDEIIMRNMSGILPNQ